jgi:hypothetical protein
MDIDGDGRDRQGRSQGCATKLGEVKICVPFTDLSNHQINVSTASW